MNERDRRRPTIATQVAAGRKHLEQVSIRATLNETRSHTPGSPSHTSEELMKDVTRAVLIARSGREPSDFNISRNLENVTAEVKTEQDRWDSHIDAMVRASEGKPADSTDPVNPNSWSCIMATDKALQDASSLTGKYIPDVSQIGEELTVAFATNPLAMADRLRTYQENNDTQVYSEKIEVLEKEAEGRSFHPYEYTEKFRTRNRQQYRLAESMASEYLVHYGNPNPTFTEKDRYRLIFANYLKNIQTHLETEIAKLNGERIDGYDNPTKEQRDTILHVAEQQVIGFIGMIVDKEELTREELASSLIRAIIHDPEDVSERLEHVSQLMPKLNLGQVKEVLDLTKDGPVKKDHVEAIDALGVKEVDSKAVSHDTVPLSENEVTVWKGITDSLGSRDDINRSTRTPFPNEEPEVGGSSQGSIADQEEGPDTDFGQGNNKGKSK